MRRCARGAAGGRPGRPGSRGRIRQPADHRDAGVDQHRLLIRERVGVELLVAAVEGGGELREQIGRLPVDRIEADAHLEDLLAVAHVGRALHQHLALE